MVMRERKCDIAGTRRNKANSVSKSMVHTRRFQLVNLQYKKLWWHEGNAFVKMRISTRTLKTIKKNGLDATARKHGINLRKFVIDITVPPGTVPNPPLKYGEVKMKFRMSAKDFQAKAANNLATSGMRNVNSRLLNTPATMYPLQEPPEPVRLVRMEVAENELDISKMEQAEEEGGEEEEEEEEYDFEEDFEE